MLKKNEKNMKKIIFFPKHTQSVTKFKKTQTVTKLGNSSFNKTQKLKLWEKKKLEIWQVSVYVSKKTLKVYFSKNI